MQANGIWFSQLSGIRTQKNICVIELDFLFLFCVLLYDTMIVLAACQILMRWGKRSLSIFLFFIFLFNVQTSVCFMLFTSATCFLFFFLILYLFLSWPREWQEESGLVWLGLFFSFFCHHRWLLYPLINFRMCLRVSCS
jgi:hypothetical protein